MMVNLSNKTKRLLKAAGEGAVWGTEATNLDVIPFSSPTLNSLNGVGGVPRGRVILIAGQPSAGKTLISLDLVKNVEAAGGSSLYIDAEFAYTPAWGESLGIKADPSEWVVRENNAAKIWQLLIGRPETYGKAQEVRGILGDKEWLEDDKLQLIIIDSLDSLISPVQEGSEIGKQNMAPTPRFLSAELPRLVEAAARANVAIVFILQVRTDLGMMYGNPETVSGGKAIRHYSSVFYNVCRKMGKDYPPIVNEHDVKIGHTVACKIDKNKVGPPNMSGNFDIKYTSGICNQDKELVTLAIANDLIERPTSQKWLYKAASGDNLEIVGRDNFMTKVLESPEIIAEMKEQLIAKGVMV